MFTNRDTIEQFRMRWRGTTTDAYAPATQMRAERLFGELELSPARMPPNAVLLIQSMRGLPSLGGFDSISVEWADELHQRIADYYRRAVRPVHGYVSPAAESIIFLDYAEALAGLTLAVIERRFWSEWCWARLIPAGVPQYTPDDVLITAWSRYSRYLPAAFSQLTPRQRYAAAQQLKPYSIEVVIRGLRTTFALPEVSIDDNMPAQMEPPWTDWLPPPPPNLARPAHYLVGLAATLRHSPAYARSQTFMRQAASWLATVDTAPPHDQSKQMTITPRPETRTQPIAESKSLRDTLESAETKSTVEPETLHQKSVPELVHDEAAQSPAIFADGLWTRFGGVLYLVNLLDWLYWPQEWGDDLIQHLTNWGLVELLGRGLMPDTVDTDDPIWDVLAALDGRESGEVIGTDFPQQSIFRLPARLLQRYAPAEAHWRVAVVNDRLRLLDDTDLYLIAEEPLNGREPIALVEAVTASYRAEGIRMTWAFGDDQPDQALTPFVQQASSPGAQIWLRRTAGFIRYWLRQMADLKPEQMLQATGRVLVSHTHVDLFLPIEAVDIQIRRVGLDRNPGWKPDFGYIILFHFNE